MAVRSILRIGDPRLEKISRPVRTDELRGLEPLLEDLRDTMLARGGVGIAAPQIGVLLRVILFGFEESIRYPEVAPLPFTYLINPQITPCSTVEIPFWEGCLSVPELRGEVWRPDHIHYEALSPCGTVISREAEGFHARVIQHECDHLDGVLFPHRLRDPKRFGFREELEHRHTMTLAKSLPQRGAFP